MWKALLKKLFKMRDKLAMDLGKPDEEKPFLEHLEDLRTMLVRMAVTLLIFVIGTFFFYKELFHMIMLPLKWAGINAKLINIDPTSAFMTAVNVSMVAGIILCFPLLIYFLLQFVLPGLKHNEKKLIFPIVGIGGGLFMTGVCFAYFLALPGALKFFNDFGTDLGFEQTWTVEQYTTFATRFILIFGVSFELPVIVMALVKLEILTYKTMKNTWKQALVAVVIFAAVITPTQDIFTLMVLAGPLYILYLACIWLAYFMEKKDRAEYPEYYAQLDKDEKELEKESAVDDWDNESYNPLGDSASDDDDEDYKRSRRMAEEKESAAQPSSGIVDGEPAGEAERREPPSPAHEEKPREKLEWEADDDSERRNTD
ncbi:MAG: twin-arginine translocase subunit TatC [Verrucomicrobiaceae bacterium]|nr:twin-arginine translocase subunit TatC [Verrucomicrobiaceae bacterium]